VPGAGGSVGGAIDAATRTESRRCSRCERLLAHRPVARCWPLRGVIILSAAWCGSGCLDRRRKHQSGQLALLQPVRPSRTRKIATRGGLVWDVCTAGRPHFRTALEPHLAHEITHVGVIGTVAYKDSIAIVPVILRTLLLTPGTPVVNTDTIEAARKAAARRLFHIRLGYEQAPASE
jgi:hypothetical protein